MTCQPLWIILCCLPEKERKETEEIVEEVKERNTEEREEYRRKTEIKETEEITTFPLYAYLLQGQQALPNCKPISCLCWGFTAQSTQWGHVERGQFT